MRRKQHECEIHDTEPGQGHHSPIQDEQRGTAPNAATAFKNALDAVRRPQLKHRYYTGAGCAVLLEIDDAILDVVLAPATSDKHDMSTYAVLSTNSFFPYDDGIRPL